MLVSDTDWQGTGMKYNEDILRLNPTLTTSLSPKKNKYGAVKTDYKGEIFHSKREAEYCQELELRRMAGELVYIRQVPFPLAGGSVTYVADFLIFYPDGRGRAEVHEVKGFPSPTWKIKKKLFQQDYSPIRLIEVH